MSPFTEWKRGRLKCPGDSLSCKWMHYPWAPGYQHWAGFLCSLCRREDRKKKNTSLQGFVVSICLPLCPFYSVCWYWLTVNAFTFLGRPSSWEKVNDIHSQCMHVCIAVPVCMYVCSSGTVSNIVLKNVIYIFYTGLLLAGSSLIGLAWLAGELWMAWPRLPRSKSASTCHRTQDFHVASRDEPQVLMLWQQ